MTLAELTADLAKARAEYITAINAEIAKLDQRLKAAQSKYDSKRKKR